MQKSLILLVLVLLGISFMGYPMHAEKKALIEMQSKKEVTEQPPNQPIIKKPARWQESYNNCCDTCDECCFLCDRPAFLPLAGTLAAIFAFACWQGKSSPCSPSYHNQ